MLFSSAASNFDFSPPFSSLEMKESVIYKRLLMFSTGQLLCYLQKIAQLSA
jgi:hypothetical protein